MAARGGAKFYQTMTSAGSTETIAYGVLYNRDGRRQSIVSTSAPDGYLPAEIVRRMVQRREIMARVRDDGLHGEERIMMHAERTRLAAAEARTKGLAVPEEWWVETIGAGNPIDRDRCAPKMAAAGIERATELESQDHAETRRRNAGTARRTLKPSGQDHDMWRQRQGRRPGRG
jgi:hypothetical protein